VIKGTEQQHRVNSSGRSREISCIAAFGDYAVKLRRRLYVVDDRVHEVNLLGVVMSAPRLIQNTILIERGISSGSPPEMGGTPASPNSSASRCSRRSGDFLAVDDLAN
jgi:hypothetical protein